MEEGLTLSNKPWSEQPSSLEINMDGYMLSSDYRVVSHRTVQSVSPVHKNPLELVQTNFSLLNPTPITSLQNMFPFNSKNPLFASLLSEWTVFHFGNRCHYAEVIEGVRVAGDM